MKLKLFFLFFSLVLASCESENQSKNFPDTVTAEKILQVELGMDKQEVISTLGEPLEKSCDACETSQFTYTKAEKINYPMIWVGFENQKVSAVMVKYYYVFDDNGIYGLSFDKHSGKIHRWGETTLEEFIH